MPKLKSSSSAVVTIPLFVVFALSTYVYMEPVFSILDARALTDNFLTLSKEVPALADRLRNGQMGLGSLWSWLPKSLGAMAGTLGFAALARRRRSSSLAIILAWLMLIGTGGAALLSLRTHQQLAGVREKLNKE